MENKTMKKTLLAVTLAATLISGCSSIMGNETRSYSELKEEGQLLFLASNVEVYSASNVQVLEAARLGINSVFLIAEPMYERYTEKLINTPELGNYMAATEAVDSEEKKQAIYDALTPDMKNKVDEYVNSSAMKEVMESASEVALVLLKNSSVFINMNSNPATIFRQIDFADLPAEKARIAHTYNQLAYMDTTLVSAYENYKVISSFSNAQ